MAELTSLPLDRAIAIGQSHGLVVSSVDVVRGGSVNSNFRLSTAQGASFFLRIYEEQTLPGALAEVELLGGLSRAGVPTPVPIARTDGALLSAHAGKPVAIFPWVEGGICCQRGVTPARAAKVGAALAAVHAAGVAHESAGRFTVEALFARLDHVDSVAPTFAAVTGLIRGRLEHWSARRDPELPQGVIHGDLFRDNVLWQGESVAALIDFESASRGPFAYDLMVCVLAWCFGSSFEPELVRGMLSGYAAVRRLEPRELAALQTEAALGALRFATTRLTDYSLRAAPGKPPLRDYRRFMARLTEIEAGVLGPVIESFS